MTASSRLQFGYNPPIGVRFRLECWSVLMWVAARYPGPTLGTCLMRAAARA